MKPTHLCVIAAVCAVATAHAGDYPTAPIARPPAGPSAIPGLSQPAAATKVRIAEDYARQALGFEANRGQTDAHVQFVSRGAGYTLFLTSIEAILRLRNAPQELRMKLVDSNPAPRVSQEDEQPGKSNYIIGTDRKNWHTQVPRYGKVRYQGVYPGVDLVYYGNQQQLEYDFMIAPGADPDAIELAFEGARNIRVDASGDLILEIGDSEVRLKAPVIYQETGGRRVEVPGGYTKTSSDRVRFHLGSYDSTKPLVIDPILIYSTYLGGSNQDFALGIAVDSYGNTFITGLTSSLDFPMSSPAHSACAANLSNGYPDCADVFITVLTPGRGIGYSTYLGGTSRDIGTGVAVDSIRHAVYVTGLTDSRDFPTTLNAVEPTFGNNPQATTRAFVFKLNGEGLPGYSTYLGGNEPSVVANAIAVDAEGAAYVTGTAGNPYDRLGNAFVTKLTPDGSAVAYSLRLGGPAVGYSIAVDTQGSASVTGETYSPAFRVNVSQPTIGRGFAAKLVPDGSALVYSTYLDGDGIGTGIALADPYTYITGVMPGGPGRGPTDAFVEVLGFGGQRIKFTNLGGTGEDLGSSIGVDQAGFVWVTGVTTSTDFPLVNPLQGQVHDRDAFVVRFNLNLEPMFSTYLGGGGREQLHTMWDFIRPGAPGPALALDRSLDYSQIGRGSAVWVAGFTDSTDFPTAGSLPTTQPTTNGPINSFVAALFDDGVPTKPNLAVTNHPDFPTELKLGATLPYLFQVTNKGPARATNVWFVDKLPPGVLVGQVFVVAPSTSPQPCNHDNMWVACRVAWTLSQGESVSVLINATPTTVGPQINTAAVLVDGDSSHALAFWLNGFNQDLIWGADAGRDGDIRDNSVTTTTVVTPGSADLSVTGSASSDVVMLDGTLTYTLDVQNRGPAASTAATLTDTLPAGATLISVTQSGSVGSCAGTTVITCQWPSLSGVARVTIVVRAITPAPLTNTAVVTGTASDPDSSNNAVTLTTRVNRPPAANAGPDQIVSAGASCQAIVTLNGTGSSDPDGDPLMYAWTIDNLPPPILFSPTDPSTGTVTGPTPSGPLPLGAHTITLTVNDGYGGTSSDTVVVTVRDATAPTFGGVPAPVTLEQSSALGTAFTVAMPAAADNCSGSVVVSSNAPAIFPRGSTTVTFTARDAAGNTATATTIVTVADTTPPTFSGVPPPITVEQAGPSGTSVAVPLPVANDAVSGLVAVSSNAPAIFPHGSTTVTFTAADAAGNSATATTTVSVSDTTALTFSGVPLPMTVEQAGPSGTSVVVPMPIANDTVSGSVAVSSNAPATFPRGVTTVTFTAADAAGNSATATTTVTVVDTTPPTFSGVPPPRTVEQAGPSGTSLVVPMPVASDTVSSVVLSSDAPAIFPKGTTIVTFTARDGAGNSATATTTVTVVDTTPPTFSGVPPPRTVEQAGPSGTSLTLPMPVASDTVSGSVEVSSNAPSTFPRGVTTVTFTARDAAGNSATATTTVTVVDTTPPTFSGVPPPRTVEQAGPSGTSVTVPIPVASDTVSGSVVVSSNAPAVFPRGATTVTFTARDAAGNSATATTSVTVVDTVSPALTIASPQARVYAHSDVLTINFSATDSGSGLAAGIPTARLDGAAVANGQSISMLTLALGTHNFVLTATDVAGNSRSQIVTFTVAATFDSLIASVNIFAGQKKIDDANAVKSLLAKLNDAKQAAQRGNKTTAINKLMEFIDLVRAQNGRHIRVDAAQILTADAQYVIGTLR